MSSGASRTGPAVMSSAGAPPAEPGIAAAPEDRLVDFADGHVARRLAFLAQVDERVVRLLEEAIARASTAHREMAGTAGLSAAGVAQGVGERPSQSDLDVYRDAFNVGVLSPLEERMRSIDAGAAVASAWSAFWRDINVLADEAPDRVVRPEPPHLYAVAPSDGVTTRARKLAVRRGRRGRSAVMAATNLTRRLLRRPPLEAAPPMQVIPLRTLFQFHAAVRLPAAEAALGEAVQQRIAAVFAELEGVLAGHVRMLLDVTTKEEGGTAAELRDHAGVLAESLGRLSRIPRCGDLADVNRDALEQSWHAASHDIEYAGTFAVDTGARGPWSPARVQRTGARRTERWTEWYREAAARIGLATELVRFRAGVQLAGDNMVSAIGDQVAAPVIRMLRIALEVLRARRADLTAALDAEVSATDHFADELAATIERVTAGIDAGVVKPLAQLDPVVRMQEAAETGVTSISQALHALPAVFSVHSPSAGAEGAVDPGLDRATVRLRDVAEQAFDVLVLEQVRVSPYGLRAAIERAHLQAEQLSDVVRFNLEAAIDALPAGEEDPIAARATARELALSGLARCEDRLAAHADEIEAEQRIFAGAVGATQRKAWRALADRICVEDGVQEQLLDLRYHARIWTQASGARARQGLRQAVGLAARGIRAGRSRARELVRVGQSAVEGAAITAEEQQRTLDALVSVENTLAGLPLVYSRLFSFEPVSDPLLVEGRTAELTTIRTQIERWRRGHCDALVVSGYDGSGRTSLVNAVLRTPLADFRVHRLALDERVEDASHLAARLAAQLEPANGESWTLERLADHLLARGRGEPPTWFIIENIEHLLLRTTAGNGPIGELFAFLSRTDSVVLWLATISESAWRYIEGVAPAQAQLVQHQSLCLPDRDTLEAIIMNRHMRSGLPLRFLEPQVASPLLKRRLRRASKDADRQALLRTEYFDRLTRVSGQSILLALFYWLRSARVETGQLLIDPVDPLSFAFLDEFDMARAFTLKAFLDHTSLTIAEHDVVLRCTRGESRRVFESLGNLLLIEPVRADARLRNFRFTTVSEDQRYRIRPLLVQPVTAFLRSRNIIH